MNANQLLDVIGETQTDYLQAALKTKDARPGRRSVHKIVLIAAVVSLMVMLLGCAVVMRNLRDMAIADYPVTQPYDETGERVETTEKTMTVISLGGYKDSTEYLAAKEWYEFTQSYDTDRSILASVGENNLDIPADYQYVYGCYTQEMVDKVDEIAAKYGLTLMGTETVVQRWQQPVLFEALGIDGVCHEEKAARVTDGAGYFYPNGDFKLEFEVLLPQEDGSWGYEIGVSLLYTKQGWFSPKYSVVDIDDHEQWMYTTADGTDVLIAQGDGGAILFAEQENAYVTVLLHTSMMGEEGTPDKADIQQAADIIDFTIRPQEADLTDIDAKLAAAEEAYRAAQEQKKAAVSSYADLIRVNYIEGAGDKLGTASMRNYYALYDIDDNGVDELLLGRENDYFCDFYTVVDGDIVRCGMWSHYNVCENGIIRIVGTAEATGDQSYCFCKFEGTRLGEALDNIVYVAEEDTWYRESMVNCVYMADGTLESFQIEHEPITAEEAAAVIAKYPLIDLEMKPISEFPME